MKLELTKKEYGELLKLAYLGSWISRVRRGPGERVKFRHGERAVFSVAPEFGYGALVEWCEHCKEYHPADALMDDEELAEALERYEEAAFWEALATQMGDRDFFRAYTPEQIGKMSPDQQFERSEPFRERWDEELAAFGIERLGVVDSEGEEEV